MTATRTSDCSQLTGPGRLLRCLAVCLFSLVFAGPTVGPAWSQPSLEERVRQLEDLVRQQGELLEKQQEHIDAQNRRIEHQEEQIQMEAEAAHSKGAPIGAVVPVGETTAGPVLATGAPKVDDGKRVDVSLGYGGVQFKSRDGKFKFGVGGRLQADWAAYAEDVSPMGGGAEIRRARLKGFGTMWNVWDYKLELNFSTDAEAEITDAWIQYTGFKPARIIVGHQKVPFSLQSTTSSNWQVFQERALPDAFIDSEETGRRRLGLALAANGDLWTAHTGVYGEGIDDSGPINQDWGVAGRFVVHPIAEKTRVLAAGGSVYYRDFNGGNDLRFRARPESHIAATRLVDTGDLIGEDNLLLYNAEATGVYGPFHAQFEYTGTNVNRDGLSNPGFGGFYVQTGYFLTGESRNYDPKTASYKRPMPKGIVGDGGWGAWEIAARYSYLDLQDSGVLGGKEWDVTFGINWWATPSVAFRFNYVYADANPNSTETLGGVDEQVNVFQGRAQIVF
ncbi:MAG: porin [Myxococcales bacterium]|nr:MAG: porin [Myxococcales bacterium]